MKSTFMSGINIAIIVLVLVLLPWLVGCEEGQPPATKTIEPPSDTTSIPLKTLAAGYSTTANITDPTIYVIGSPEDMKGLNKSLEDLAVIAQIENQDLDTNWIVAVFRGEVPTSAEGIQVVDVLRKGEEIQVIVEFIQPDPDQPGSDVIAYPYQIFAIHKDEVKAEAEIPWSMVDLQGKQLAKYAALSPPAKPTVPSSTSTFESLAQGYSTLQQNKKKALQSS